ncbi:MAG: uracil-DNA glycosylase [Betaproteobacteria bacterium]|nr:uracil-DNA glycosylase [Betaproteobacteria bacterium]
MKALDRFLDDLAAFQSPRVFNPWRDVDPVNDIGKDAPAIRRDQLRRYLAERVGHAKLLLVAEAAGYQGCKFTGLAMTSERQLLAAGPMDEVYFAGEKRRTSRASVKPAGFNEPTATVVWRTLLTAGLRGREWVNWNTFAWHPFDDGALTNRTPTRQELEAGAPALERFLALFPGVPVVTVGEKARGKLGELGVEALAAVRHPAYGGAAEFGRGIERLLEAQQQ